jgi:hypothetical protein
MTGKKTRQMEWAYFLHDDGKTEQTILVYAFTEVEKIEERGRRVLIKKVGEEEAQRYTFLGSTYKD